MDIVERSQRDPRRLLVDRVPANISVGVIMAFSNLFTSHPEGEDADRAIVATMVTELPPPPAHTLLTTEADAQETSEHLPDDTREAAIRADIGRVARRLLATDLPSEVRNAPVFVHHPLMQPE